MDDVDVGPIARPGVSVAWSAVTSGRPPQPMTRAVMAIKQLKHAARLPRISIARCSPCIGRRPSGAGPSLPSEYAVARTVIGVAQWTTDYQATPNGPSPDLAGKAAHTFASVGRMLRMEAMALQPPHGARHMMCIVRRLSPIPAANPPRDPQLLAYASHGPNSTGCMAAGVAQP
jgi:hypothetical protein